MKNFADAVQNLINRLVTIVDEKPALAVLVIVVSVLVIAATAIVAVVQP